MGITDFLASPSGKRITGTAYGFGASIVIVGALFKIMHWPFAGPMLCVGMFTEAILFALSALEKPHKEWEWSLVFPELEGEEAHEKKDGKLPALDVPALVEDEIKKLSEGVVRLNQTAGQLGSLTSAASASETYVANMSKASDAITAFADSQKSLSNSSEFLAGSYQNIASNFGSVAEGSKALASQLDGINQNVSTINSVFELQAKSVAEQNESMKAQNDAIKTMASTVAGMESVLVSSAKQAEEYRLQVAALTQQVKSLNDVYGNMLNAMTIRG